MSTGSASMTWMMGRVSNSGFSLCNRTAIAVYVFDLPKGTSTRTPIRT